MFQVKKLIYCIIAVAAVSACGSKNKSSSPVAATAPGTYQMVNNQCYHSSNLGLVVDMTLCNQHNNQYNNQYYINNVGVCVDRTTGQVAPNPSYCQTNQNQYVFNGANCVDRITQVPVNPTYCNNSGGAQYYMNGNVCFDRYSNQPCNPQYCQGGNYGGKCYGYFYFYSEDEWGPYIVDTYCSGNDCSGFALYETQTNQFRYCQ